MAANDAYAMCPGGTGKKVKFCCSDLVGELNTIQRMIAANQRVGCLDLLQKLEAKHGSRACLLAAKALLADELGDSELAAQNIENYLANYPDNPIAVAEQAIVKSQSGDLKTAIRWLSQALYLSVEATTMSSRVYDAIDAIAQAALEQNAVITARSLFMLQMALVADGHHQAPLRHLMSIFESPEIPLLFKEPLPWPVAPEGVVWATAYNEAMRYGGSGAWHVAAEKLQKALEDYPDEPVLWKSLAYFYCRLFENESAADALRRFARLSNSIDDAVEAEALAQLVAMEDPIGPEIEIVATKLQIVDQAHFDAQLQHPQLAELPISDQLASRDGPPPKAIYQVLQSALPATGVDIAYADVPEVVGSIFVYGQQTDQPARLELNSKNYLTQSAIDTLQAIFGSSISAPVGKSTQVSSITASMDTFGWSWYFPTDTPGIVREKLSEQRMEQVLLEKWPNTPMRLFQGQTPREFSQEQTQAPKLALQAAILLLEQADDAYLTCDTYNQLRSKLGLPLPEPVNPTVFSTTHDIPLTRYGRLELTQLSNEDLAELFRRVFMARLAPVYQKFADEIFRRCPEIETHIDLATVYGLLAQSENDPFKAIEYVRMARNLAEKSGKSVGVWDIEELALLLRLGDMPRAEQLIAHIVHHHQHDPNILATLKTLLMHAGIMTSSGELPFDVRALAGSNPYLPSANPAASQLWTPEQERAKNGQNSSLWLPD